MVADNPVSTKNKTQIKDLLEKLRNKLKGFAIINMQGQLVGRVKDIFLDKSYHLNVVMSKAESPANPPIYLLSSKYIEKVDAVHRLLFVDITPVELEELPLYSVQNKQVAEIPGSSPTLSLTEETTRDFEAQKIRETDLIGTPSSETEIQTEVAIEDVTEFDDSSNVVEEELVRLLEERVIVNRRKHKIGEVVVRKEIETQIIEVPIQREILIIEQVGSETKRLAAIDLSKGEITGVELANPSSSEIHHPKESHHQKESHPEKGYSVKGEFVSPRAASNLLEAIALQKRHGCVKVRVELTVENAELQKSYQNMFDRCSIR
jgi:stress response protein YsnF